MWAPLIIIAVVLIGISVYYYYYYRKVEKFAEEPVNIQDAVDGLAQLLTEVGSGNIPEGHPYVETLETVPSSLKFYLTSFSQRTKYDSGLKVYLPEMQRWYNFIKANESFFVRGASNDISASIQGSGMKLKNVALEGLRSDELNMTDYSLKSFSATFFITFAETAEGSNTFIVPDKCDLFTISLESPNFVKLSLIEGAAAGSGSGAAAVAVASTCNFVLQIGSTGEHQVTTPPINKADLILGSPVAITISYNINTTTNKVLMDMYIGKYLSQTQSYSDIITPVSKEYLLSSLSSPLILGNSRMSINKNQTSLDANLLAFMLFSTQLSSTDHVNVTTYLAKENRTETGILNTLNTAATTQLQTIRQLIATNTTTQGTLQQQLNKCKASVKIQTPVVKAFSHLIKLDGDLASDVSTEDLRSCSVLEVKKRLANAVTAAAATATATGGPRFQINMPRGSSSNVTPVPPPS